MTGLIIPYQELPGNYNVLSLKANILFIIPYQELPGNYNEALQQAAQHVIIPYQELPGNYNVVAGFTVSTGIIPYQELPGNYNSCGSDVVDIQNYTIFNTRIKVRKSSFSGILSFLFHSQQRLAKC